MTLDMNADHPVDVVWNLEDVRPLPFEGDSFDEVHAYETLEHIGDQGDYETFFRQFSDYWRVLRPGGLFAATVPKFDDLWAWGDPSHRRIINHGTLAFLSQAEYSRQVGKTAMRDFRFCYRADFDVVQGATGYAGGTFVFLLKAIKPSRVGR